MSYHNDVVARLSHRRMRIRGPFAGVLTLLQDRHRERDPLRQLSPNQVVFLDGTASLT